MNLKPYSSKASRFRVDGKFLVVEPCAVLPAICVKTNQPVSKQHIVTKQYVWCSKWILLLLPLGLIPCVIVYYVIAKKCKLTFGLHPAAKRKFRNRILIKIAVTIGLLISPIVLILAVPNVDNMYLSLLVGVMFVLLIVSILLLFVGHSPLKVVKHRRMEFWIAGCSMDFLANIKSQAES